MIARVVLEMHERGDAVDFVSLRGALGPAGLESIGGLPGLSSLIDEYTTPTAAETYAKQVLDAAVKRSEADPDIRAAFLSAALCVQAETDPRTAAASVDEVPDRKSVV